MATKTFAYQLGEIRGLTAAQASAAAGTLDTVDPGQLAIDAATGQYDVREDGRSDYIEGFLAAWADFAHIPAFLHMAQIDPPVIVTEGRLIAALLEAFPQANVIDYHGRLARFLINHITTD